MLICCVEPFRTRVWWHHCSMPPCILALSLAPLVESSAVCGAGVPTALPPPVYILRLTTLVAVTCCVTLVSCFWMWTKDCFESAQFWYMVEIKSIFDFDNAPLCRPYFNEIFENNPPPACQHINTLTALTYFWFLCRWNRFRLWACFCTSLPENQRNSVKSET